MAVRMSEYLQERSLRPVSSGALAVPPAPASTPASGRSDAVASVAHDLRTPLAAFNTTLDILDDFSTMSHEEVYDLLHRLKRGVAWMNGLVDNLATWSAIQEGRLSVRRAPVTMTAWVASAIEMVTPILERRGQMVHLTCPKQELVVYVDAIRLGQALVNLLTNASAYSGYGEVIDVSISVSCGAVRVTVADKGPGIPVEEQEHVFGRYSRGAGGTECRPDGQGLGLHIVKTLVQLHDGEVGLDSAPGRGSSFWFTLPYPSSTGMESAVA